MRDSRSLRRLELGRLTKPAGILGTGSFILGNILIVGEQAASPSTSPEQEPFCTSRGCSGWLNAKLELAGIPEDLLFWVNALNNDGTTLDLTFYVDQLQPMLVFALGRVAKNSCINQRINHESFPHPQYWRRFRTKEPYPLIVRLEELVKIYQFITKS